MLKANMHEAKTHLSALVAKAEAGEVVIITRAGKPAVRLVPEILPETMPAKKGRRFPFGCLKHLGPLDPNWDSKETNEEIARLFNGE